MITRGLNQPFVAVRSQLEDAAVAKAIAATVLVAVLLVVEDLDGRTAVIGVGAAALVAAASYGLQLRGMVPRHAVPLLPPRVRVEARHRSLLLKDSILMTCALLAAGLPSTKVLGVDTGVTLAAIGLGFAAACAVTAARVRAWERLHGHELVAPEERSEERDYVLLRFGRPRPETSETSAA